MRITHEKGKKYRAYSPQEFFRSPENPQLLYSLNKPKPKRPSTSELADKINQKSD